MRYDIEMYKPRQESTSSDSLIGINNTLLNPPKVSQVKLLRQGRLPAIDSLMQL
jgi:hypothetical protein